MDQNEIDKLISELLDDDPEYESSEFVDNIYWSCESLIEMEREAHRNMAREMLTDFASKILKG